MLSYIESNEITSEADILRILSQTNQDFMEFHSRVLWSLLKRVGSFLGDGPDIIHKWQKIQMTF